MKKLLIVIIFSGVFCKLFAVSEIDSLMKVLDHTIDNRTEYMIYSDAKDAHYENICY